MSTSPTRRFNSRSTAQDVVKEMDLKAKTIAITGTTSGIGIETTRALSMAGAHVVMFIRNVEAGKSLHGRIIDDYPEANIDIIDCDLKCLANVKRAAEEFLSKGWPLHVLILNAGVVGTQDPDRTVDGYETTFAVNHLAQYYLCKLLLDVMLQSTPARVVVVSSESHRHGPGMRKDLQVDDLTSELLTEPVGSGMMSTMEHYGKSKMCNVWFANALDRQYKDNGLRAVSLHPGALIPTSIAKDWWSRFATYMAKPFSKSLSQGAATSVFCAVDPSIDTIADVGRYYMDCWYTPAHRLTDDVGLQLKLGTISDMLIEKALSGEEK